MPRPASQSTLARECGSKGRVGSCPFRELPACLQDVNVLQEDDQSPQGLALFVALDKLSTGRTTVKADLEPRRIYETPAMTINASKAFEFRAKSYCEVEALQSSSQDQIDLDVRREWLSRSVTALRRTRTNQKDFISYAPLTFLQISPSRVPARSAVEYGSLLLQAHRRSNSPEGGLKELKPRIVSPIRLYALPGPREDC